MPTERAMGWNAYLGDLWHGKLRLVLKYLGLLGAIAGCGDNLGPPQTPAEVLAALQALPHVHDAVEAETQTQGFHYFVVHFEQPVDHDDAAAGTFLQEVSILHRATERP